MSDCVFCDIVEDPSESHIVWEDDVVLAFMDINPVTDGHCLVVPKQHFIGLDDLPEPVAARMMNVGQRLTLALKTSALRCEGVNLFFADGEAAFQEVFHSHLHVIPRFQGDGFKIDARWDGSRAEDLHNAANLIRAAIT